jgi:diguanylate cyclase (GGDEF)-like protein
MRVIDELKACDRLPSPKGVALALMQVCQREDATTQEVSKIVQTDPALSGCVIKQANSAAHGGSRPVASVNEAVMRLGIGTVRQLALGFSLVNQHLAGPCKAFDYPRFWSHSLLMALAMQDLGSHTRAGAADELFACGLLARIGTLALATAYPAEYAELLQTTGLEASLIQQERQRLETDHNELTMAMLSDWGIPKALAEPVFHHEDPASAGFASGTRAHMLVHLLYMAKRLADLGVAEESERNRITAELMLLGGNIGLDSEDLGARVDAIMPQWLEWGALLKVPAACLPPFAKMETSPTPRPPAEQGATAMRILLVEDSASSRQLLEKILRQDGHTVFSATNGREALSMALEVMPQVVITDWVMPEMDGVELCKSLRATEWGRDLYLLMLTSVEAVEDLVKAYEAGVDEYVTKPVNPDTLQARLRAAWRYVKLQEEWERDRAQLKQFAAELAIANRKLKHAALTDYLTGLFNRRAAMDLLAQAWSSATRANSPLVAMAIDIDHFKGINDQHGHAVGDQVLREVAKTLRAAARKEDNVCRIGGEEFLVICQNADFKAAVHSAERLRQTVNTLNIPVGQLVIKTSVSIGLAQKEPDTAHADALVSAADTALYAAKKHGRNCTCIIAKGKVTCGNS